VFFSSKGRSLEREDEIRLLSVGVDIGSSTSHLVFSRIVLERLDARYVVSEREVFHQSDILLTPYAGEDTIDAPAIGAFIATAYKDAMVSPEEIDTGALILTGVAVARRNARAIGELFAREAGKLVAVSAGDSLETIMAAHGAGAVARSIRDGAAVMNVDVGGGTSKIAICAQGRVAAVTALDVGARLICVDRDGTIRRVEAAGKRFGAELGLTLEPGSRLADGDARRLAGKMADGLFEAMRGGSPAVAGRSLMRLDPLRQHGGSIGALTFSGGVSEFIYGREAKQFDDLGPALADEIHARIAGFGTPLVAPAEHIRATVIGAAQYTTQVSGSTIFVSPLDALPLRNIPVIAPKFTFDEEIDADEVASSIRASAAQLELTGTIAVFVPWRGSATFARLDAFCRGVTDGLADLAANAPIVLAGDSDVGGLIGVHLCEELKVARPVISIDGLELADFDYIDIGALLENSGAVPVVIKSLVFPGGSPS
jgi:ethanolamine utilization protein EutA